MKTIGKITHYYDKIGVAIVELTAGLKTGETVKIAADKPGEFDQLVDSMQMNHEAVAKAKKGDVIGIKVGQLVKEGMTVSK